jgi:hypothetical protein
MVRFVDSVEQIFKAADLGERINPTQGAAKHAYVGVGQQGYGDDGVMGGHPLYLLADFNVREGEEVRTAMSLMMNIKAVPVFPRGRLLME